MATTKPFVVGDALAVMLDKAVLDATGITQDTVLEVSTHGDIVVFAPVHDKARSQRMAAIIDGIFTRHARAFTKLEE